MEFFIKDEAFKDSSRLLPPPKKEAILTIKDEVATMKDLIPYSAIELKEANDQEYTLTLELAESIAKHTITCFVRYYEQTIVATKNRESTLVDSENIVETDTTLATATTENVGPSILPLTPTKKPYYYSIFCRSKPIKEATYPEQMNAIRQLNDSSF
ncbi:hypothetical protein ACH5RR_021698 [Cinchona calisaya]|uniref:Uncharacterized protein n=1 Tax=Cinchona calisaya TaxID=153742 RepID=A0ABD2ZJ08_9GENT